MAETRAQLNRKVRQEALREQLSAGGHLQHAVEIATKYTDLPQDEQPAYRIKFEMQMRLADKYLPNLKAIEHTGDGGDPLADFFNELKNRSTGLPEDE